MRIYPNNEDEARMNLSHSYPFLHLSQIFRVSYEAVLDVAEAYDKISEEGKKTVAPARTTCGQFIREVCDAPWRWQYPPQGRGL